MVTLLRNTGETIYVCKHTHEGKNETIFVADQMQSAFLNASSIEKA